MTSPDMLAILARGNIASLSEEDRTRYILALCEALSLDPRFKPIDLIPGQGGALVPYLNRGATDSLARREGIQRVTVVSPKVVDIDGVKCVLCIARATDTRTLRYEERTATMIMRDHANAYMRCETKAIRRATIAVLGIGMLDESELDGIRGADAIADTARAQALQAHVEATVERMKPILPTLAGASEETRRAYWESQRAQLALDAGITVREAQSVLKAAIQR
jgi:hypothetical protein